MPVISKFSDLYNKIIAPSLMNVLLIILFMLRDKKHIRNKSLSHNGLVYEKFRELSVYYSIVTVVPLLLI